MTDFLGGRVVLHHGDCREVIAGLADASIDAVVTDPPYALVSVVKRFGKDGAAPAQPGVYARASAGFMGQRWDNGEVAFDPAFWAEVLRVLKPGGHVLACGGTRTYHRLVCAIEDGGFEIRDSVAWLYGSGFPKSHDIGKAIDRAAGAEREVVGRRTDRAATPKRDIRGGQYIGATVNIDLSAVTAPATDLARQWDGWASALKPALELVCLARKPLIGTIAQNVIAHGVGGLNIDATRIASAEQWDAQGSLTGGDSLGRYGAGLNNSGRSESHSLGRWPANVVHDGSDEVLAAFAAAGERAGAVSTGRKGQPQATCYGDRGAQEQRASYADFGSAARFFFQAKADSDGRAGSAHPTVKPVDLMRWLVRLVTPPGGLVLDPFAGSGTTAEACFLEGMRAILIEREEGYCADIGRRLDLLGEGAEQRALRLAALREERRPTPWDEGTLFA